MFSKATLAASALAFFSSVNAHMFLAQPIPFAGMDNSPLNNAAPGSSGSNFPCKIPAGGKYTVDKMNNIEVGTPQTLSFKGGATHGGGSCQVSVTLDQEPTVKSQWKVVHSIIGGCPVDSSGNTGNSADSTGGLNTFKFTLPEGMPNGKYTLAWTWFNKIGNREMYMQCAPIQVTGGTDSKDVFNSLPDMFVVNLPREECTYPEGNNLVFPNPGRSVQTMVSGPFATAVSGSGCSAMAKVGAGNGQAGSPGQGSGNNGGANPPAPAPGNGSGSGSGSSKPGSGASPTQNNGGQFAPVPSATSLVTVVQPTAAPTPAAPAPAPAAPAGGNGSSGSGSCSNGAVQCSNDGGVVCMGNNKWGLCDRGCAVPQLMAAGMICEGGQMKAGGKLRMRGHSRAHRRGVVAADF